MSDSPKTLRNVAIIAHVDHGKTTLVDNLFKQSGTVRDNQRLDERAMDSNDLERERGITILAKCTSVVWNDTRINIVDTPGHADFGGEVERILSMVDGVVLLVDAAEGPMPQTKFVTQKALALGLRPIVVVNKVDKPDGNPDAATDACFDLFVNLDASEDQLDFPILYASGRDGWCVDSLDDPRENLNPLFSKIIEHVPAPKPLVNQAEDKPFSMLATLLDRDNFIGRVLTGRIETGHIKVGDPIHALGITGKVVETGRITKLLSFRGLERVPVEEARAGDIVAIAGLQVATVADTICVPEVTVPLKAQPVDPPTLAMTFSVNDSPLAGREGKHVTSRVIRDRLLREAEGNVAIKITETENKDAFEVAGRGELQLGVLIETMRREGFELAISRPRVLMKLDENCKKLEPYETVQVDVDEAYQGTVVEKMSLRKAELTGMVPSGGGKVRLTFDAPARGLIGYHGEFLTDTRGTGIMARVYDRYDAYKGPITGRQRGVLIATAPGKAVAYALFNLEERGIIMIEPGDEVYEGMIIGENSRDNDLEVNVQKAKQLTNIRAAGKDDAVKLTPPRKLPLEEALSYINDDELVEVTPESIRLRKRFLLAHERKKAARAAEA
ncbi:GTP-binding protein [Kordiimonas sediminis]|uniref:Large ribosomal subunit assembly factor BipA n=1 Tax=Kordiimonas sediminis TaxID=1735581 RepID=A0A919E465_9PROT|nr:translational GTPase TypA [Kordiimonas sediminis]GHF11190.1 GTP-binding protein [Kordiimonas sediminis]